VPRPFAARASMDLFGRDICVGRDAVAATPWLSISGSFLRSLLSGGNAKDALRFYEERPGRRRSTPAPRETRRWDRLRPAMTDPEAAMEEEEEEEKAAVGPRRRKQWRRNGAIEEASGWGSGFVPSRGETRARRREWGTRRSVVRGMMRQGQRRGSGRRRRGRAGS
jgi:hypothetical protein